MTKKEREKLEPIINAADNLAELIERLSADEDRFDANGRADITALKGMTAAMKELVGVLRNVNELPTKAEREAARTAKEKFELDKKKAEKDDTADDIRVIIEGADEWSE